MSTIAVAYTDGKAQWPVSAIRPLPVVLTGSEGAASTVSVTSSVLPTGAATAANQTTVQGTAGSPTTAVLTVQGVSGGTVIPVSQSPNSASAQSVGTAAFAATQVSVANTATLLAAARTGAPGTGRVDITIENFGTTDVFLGGSGVTTSTGMKLVGSPGAAITIPTTAAVYGIVATSTQTVSVLETY